MLYFTGIFIAVHLEAKKLGLKGMPKSEMVSWGELAKRAYLIIPLALLIFLVSPAAAPCSSPRRCPFWPPSWWAFLNKG